MKEKQTVIVIKHKHDKLFHEDANDKEHLTFEEFISDDKSTISSFVIMQEKYHLEKFYFEEEFKANTIINFSESDYFINELALSLLQHFHE